MQARDLMTTDVETVQVDETVSSVLVKLSRAPFNGFPVLDGDELVGIVTQGDLVDIFQPSDRTLWIPIGFPPFLESLTYGIDLSWDDLDAELDLARHADRPISDVMTADVITVPPDATLEEVLAILSDPERDVNRVPVVENEVVVGIVTREDALRAVYEERRREREQA